jgi:hypothetical protein
LGSVASASGAGSAGADPSGADGSGAGAAVAGSACIDSPWVDDPGAEVVVAGFSLSFTVLAALMKLSPLSYKSRGAECLLCNQMQTYSADFFMTAFFTRKAHHGVSVAGGGVSPAGGAVPATAMVTAVVADGADPTSSGSVLGGEAEGLQMDTVSMQQHRCLAIKQGSKQIPGRFDCLRLPLAHHSMTLRDRRQSFGQLHGRSGGVVPSRLPFGFLLHQGASVLRGLAAVQSRSYSSPLCFGSGAGEKMVRPGDVGLRRVAAVQFCVSL